MKDNYRDFFQACKLIQEEMNKTFARECEQVQTQNIEIQRNAIMGFEEEINIYLEKINKIIQARDLKDTGYPPWYNNLGEGVFAELYGFAGLTPWIYNQREEYSMSSSAKLIGGRLYCLINGKSELQPQTFSRERLEQLKRALLMASPKERLDKGFHEIYLKNGIRITIFSGDRVKKGEEVIVFRKYILQDLSFENLVSLGTIPKEAPALFREMVKIGFNVIIAGQVRSGKTTFLQIWQKYEYKDLEGMAIATDPETPWHKIMKDTPIMQLIADGKELEEMVKSLLRGDNDYVLMEEMRDATAYNFALDITSIGTTRTKVTIHDSNAINIPYKMATKIHAKYGGDFDSIVSQVFKNFNYVFEFCQVFEQKNMKKLKGIYEYSFDYAKNKAVIIPICRYDMKSDKWEWNYNIGEDKETFFISQKEAGESFKEKLKELSIKYPMKDKTQIVPMYYLGNREGVINEK